MSRVGPLEEVVVPMEERQSLLHQGQETVEAMDGVLEVLEESPTPPTTSLNSPHRQVKDAEETALSNCDTGSDNSSSPLHCQPVGAPSSPQGPHEGSTDAKLVRKCQPEVAPEVGDDSVSEMQEESSVQAEREDCHQETGQEKPPSQGQENGDIPNQGEENGESLNQGQENNGESLNQSLGSTRASTTMLVRPDIHGDFHNGEGGALEGEADGRADTFPDTNSSELNSDMKGSGETDETRRDERETEEKCMSEGQADQEEDNNDEDDEGEDQSINQPLIVPTLESERGQENRSMEDEDNATETNDIDDTADDCHTEETRLLLVEGAGEGQPGDPTTPGLPNPGDGPQREAMTTATDHHPAPAVPEEVVDTKGPEESAGDKPPSEEAASRRESPPDRNQLKPLPIVKDHLTVRMNLGPKLSDASTDELSDVEEEEEMEFQDRPWYKQCRRSRACCINLYFWIVLLFVGSIAALVAVGVCVVANYRAAERFEATLCTPTTTRDVGDRIKCSCGKGCTSDYRCMEITVSFRDEAGAAHHPALQDNEATLGRQVGALCDDIKY